MVVVFLIGARTCVEPGAADVRVSRDTESVGVDPGRTAARSGARTGWACSQMC